MKFNFKYGKGKIDFSVPRNNITEIVEPAIKEPANKPREVVRRSINNPIDSPRLSKVVQKAKKDPSITITVEDHSRPVPNELVLEPLLENLTELGLSNNNITILIATGLHRDQNEKELRNLRKIVGEEPQLVNHHADDPTELKKIGELHYPEDIRKELYVNRHLASSDITILTGDVEFHYLFGYGGGAKSVLPGCADAESVQLNHSLMDLEEAHSGNLDNPLRRAAERAARLLGIDFSINLVLNHDKELVNCFSGDAASAFRRAVDRVDEIYKVPYSDKAELVIVEAGGYPKDRDLYQAQKAVENGLKLVEKGGDLVLVAKCSDGWGSDTFYNWVQKVEDLSDTVDMIKENFVIGGHKAYIYAKEKSHADLHLISDLDKSTNLKKIFKPISVRSLKSKAKEASSVSILRLGSCTVPVQREK